MGRAEEEIRRLSAYECLEADPKSQIPPGVLLSDEIEHCVALFKMIEPFDRDNLKPAAYELTVGDQFSLGGRISSLAKGDKIRIPAFQVVIIKTAETLNLPRFLIARWNIRVKWAYEGLLWVGGPQVDPGWVGQLPCPIYNLSNKEVEIEWGEPIAVMDFVTTTPFRKGSSKEYNRLPKRPLFEDYNTKLQSALFTEVGQKIKILEDQADKVESQVNTFIGVTITVFTVLFAVLALFVSPQDKAIPWWFLANVVFSAFALILSIHAFFTTKSLRHK